MKSTKTLLLNVVFKSLVVAMPIFTLFSSSVFADDEVKINENETLSQFTVEQLTVSPAKIELTHRFDYRQLLITGIVNGGQKVDLTRYAKITNGPQFVKLTENRRIEPFTNGTETLQFAVGDKTVDVQVVVRGMDDDVNPSFILDVQPVLSKLGCNAGTCHGSKDGKNGFKLSLPRIRRLIRLACIGGRCRCPSF